MKYHIQCLVKILKCSFTYRRQIGCLVSPWFYIIGKISNLLEKCHIDISGCMISNRIQDILIFNVIFGFCKKYTGFCMKQRRIFPFCFCDSNVIFFADAYLFIVWYTFCTVVQKSGNHRTLQITAVAHSQGCTGIHDSKRMLIAIRC